MDLTNQNQPIYIILSIKSQPARLLFHCNRKKIYGINLVGGFYV